MLDIMFVLCVSVVVEAETDALEEDVFQESFDLPNSPVSSHEALHISDKCMLGSQSGKRGMSHTQQMLIYPEVVQPRGNAGQEARGPDRHLGE